MESVDKLREWANDRLDGYAHADAMRLADEIEREIAERYMPLPLDADGVPIRIEDKIWYCGIEFDVFAVTGEVVFRKCDFRNGRYLVEAYDHSDVRHVKPRTLEDVLADFAAEVEQDNNTIETARKYADEIRELMGGDAE